MCPHCGQSAPIVYRGIMAYCTACGRGRAPLVAASVNLAGQPSQIGGSVARVFGWLVLGVGLAFALILTALFQAIFPAGFVGWVLGGLTAALSIAVAVALLKGGRSLESSGKQAEMATRMQAIFALASNRRGVLSAEDVAPMLSITPHQADELLTAMAKEDPDRVRMDVDDSGRIAFSFPEHGVFGAADAREGGARGHPSVRVAQGAWGGPVRVGRTGTGITGEEAQASEEADAAQAARERTDRR